MDGDWGRHIEVGRWVQAGAVRTHYLAAGDPGGRSVVLVHGLLSAAQEILTPLAGPLARLGVRVVAFDRPGYGLSEAVAPRRMRPAIQAQWLGRAMDALALRRPIVVAHSFGAATALCLAADRPRRLEGLVLINPFCRPTRPASKPMLRAAAAPVLGGPIRRRIVQPLALRLGPAVVKQAFRPNPLPRRGDAFPMRRLASGSSLLAAAAELRGFNADMAPRRNALRRARTPTLVLRSTDDHGFDNLRHVRWLLARMPNAACEEAPGAGHMLHHVDPDRVARAVGSLLGRRAR